MRVWHRRSMTAHPQIAISKGINALFPRAQVFWPLWGASYWKHDIYGEISPILRRTLAFGDRCLIRQWPVKIRRYPRFGALFFVERGLQLAVKVMPHKAVKLGLWVNPVAPAEEVKPL